MRPCPRGCGGVLVARETKSCAACRAADRVRPCPYCGAQLGERQSKCCGADACKEAYRLAKQEKSAARVKQRYAEEPGYRETVLARTAAWRAVPENRDKKNRAENLYYLANREKRIALAAAHKRARRAHVKGTMVLPFTADQLRQRLSMYHGCWICGIDSWQEIDHVKPIAKGGPHMLANLRPACRDCNRRKSATWPFPTSRKVQRNGHVRRSSERSDGTH